MCGIAFIINELEKLDRDMCIKHGFHNPHSYRGDYSCLGVEYKKNAKVGEMIDCLKESIGKEFTGYKGGEFLMNAYTDVYIVREYGESCSADRIGVVLLAYMLDIDVNFDWADYGEKYSKKVK